MKKLIVTSLFLQACQLFASEVADPYAPMPRQIDGEVRNLTPEEMKIIKDPITPQLYGGRPINPGELPFSVYIGNCTSSIVGPRTILTAGHCRDTGDSATFTLDGTRYTGKCTQHPNYSKGRWLNNDFALCLMDKDITVAKMASLKPVDVEIGDTIIMQGYGAGSAGGKLNVGRTKILRSDDMEYTTDNSVHLGGGDSGGGLLEDTDDLKNGPFIVIGINSRGGGNTSLFNRTNLDRSQEFFKNWADRNNTKICGINDECGGGSPGPGPGPGPGPEPIGKCKEEGQFKLYAEQKVQFFTNMLNNCLAK